MVSSAPASSSALHLLHPDHRRRRAGRSSWPCRHCWVRGGLAGDERGNGEAAVLRQGGAEEGAVDSGGGPEAHRLHPQQRPMLLARRPQARRAAAVRQELPAPVDQLPPAGPQEGPPLRRRGEARRRPPRPARQQVVQDRVALARENGQRDKEPLEHSHQEEAQEDGDRPSHPQASPPPAAARPEPTARRRLAGDPSTATGGEEHGVVVGGGQPAAARRRGEPPQEVPRLLHRRGADDPPGRDHGAIVRPASAAAAVGGRDADDFLLHVVVGVDQLLRRGHPVPVHGVAAGQHVPDGARRHLGRRLRPSAAAGVRRCLQRVPIPEGRRGV